MAVAAAPDTTGTSCKLAVARRETTPPGHLLAGIGATAHEVGEAEARRFVGSFPASTGDAALASLVRPGMTPEERAATMRHLRAGGRTYGALAEAYPEDRAAIAALPGACAPTLADLTERACDLLVEPRRREAILAAVVAHPNADDDVLDRLALFAACARPGSWRATLARRVAEHPSAGPRAFATLLRETGLDPATVEAIARRAGAGNRDPKRA